MLRFRQRLTWLKFRYIEVRTEAGLTAVQTEVQTEAGLSSFKIHI
jgi:hypothetical protein